MNIIRKIQLKIAKKQTLKNIGKTIRLSEKSNYDPNTLNKNKETVAYISLKNTEDINIVRKRMQTIINNYAINNNLKISSIYIDEGISRKSLDKRYALNNLLKETKKRNIGQVIIPRIEHISRDYLITQKIINRLTEQEVKLVCATDGLILG